MCGISGILSKQVIDREVIVSMSAALRHRGPDAHAVFLNADATVALGHTRLSVIDPSPLSNQPLTSVDGNYTIVFNGEIYNYQALRRDLLRVNPNIRFRTSSDTEVVLEAFIHWKGEVCNKLEGMFAFAIVDHRKDEIFLCRDRVGKKPLYYFEQQGLFVFASEIKSLVKHPVVNGGRSVNYEAIYTFLHLGFVPEPETGYQQIRKFPSGHYAHVKKGFPINLQCYSTVIKDTTVNQKRQTSDAKSELRSALTEAVKKRLISDVPLGAFLSGGTDSSLIVALAAQLKPDSPLKTFSIGFNENKFDETSYAGRVASALKTDHHSYILHEHDAVSILEEYVKHFDEPFADTSAIPMMLVSKLARKEVVVALTGDGADELFLGYGAYDWANRLSTPWLRVLQSALSFGLRKFGNSRLRRIGFVLQKVAPDERRSHIFSQEQYFFTRAEIASMCLKGRPGFQSLNYRDPDGKHFTQAEQQALFDIKYYLKDDLLVKVDRASMRYGLECRCPFLDPSVIDLAVSLPAEMKKKGHHRKWILKQLLAEYLPTDLVYRPKWGFSIPLARWMKNELAYLIDSYLNESMVKHIGLVDYQHVNMLKTTFSNGADFLYNRIWVLIVAHKWLYDNNPRQ